MEKEQNAVMIKDESSVGTVRIADEVVAMIASIAASEVPGVQTQGTSPARLSKGVKVDVRSGIVYVDMVVSIQYGYNIPEISGQLQSKVKSAVENMTGLKCGNVNIRYSSVIMK